MARVSRKEGGGCSGKNKECDMIQLEDPSHGHVEAFQDDGVRQGSHQSENPYMRDVFTIKEGTPVTEDFRPDRVRVWVNDSDIVTRVPTAG
ncbi:hypothetical protein CDL15_Pgr016385 [Punica granatum]|uniref:Uncharacterized protein n=1 Tax=Punica granatum TaxID=22663 RepID=A0A218W5Y7_PUNGR|nr:hypothetical protein CDL15_Pgr016385 [Punica granatum]